MEKASKRNIVLTVIVAILILVIGVSFAYFLAQTLINGEGSTSKVTTAVIKDTTFTVTGELEFNDEGIYPGHKNVSKIKVVVKENAGVTIDYNLIWNGRNGLATPINYYVYKTTSDENPSITCEVQKGMKSGYEIIYEECTNNSFDNLGEIISSGTITTSDDTRKIVLKENESIISSDEGTTSYYYVVLEYPNLDTAQNRDSEHTFTGEVTVELYEKTTCGTHNVTTVLGVLEVNDCEPNFAYSSEEADTNKVCLINGIPVQSEYGVTEEGCSKVLWIEGIGDAYLSTDGIENVGPGTWNSETSTCAKNGEEVILAGYGGTITQEQCEKDIYKDIVANAYFAGLKDVGSGTWTERLSCSFNNNRIESATDNVTVEGCSNILSLGEEGYYTADGFKNVGSGTWDSETSTCTKTGKEIVNIVGDSITQEQCQKDVYSFLDEIYYTGIEVVGSGQSHPIIGKTGIYEADDGMFGGTSYYYRGAIENNYLKFADYCWRIVRINGDGSIRLIYDGATCHANGTEGEVAIASQKYNEGAYRNESVGYTYVEGKQRPGAGDIEVESNLKIETEKWYQENIVSKGLDNKAVISKYCNDRETANGYTWESQPTSSFYYASNMRVLNSRPTLRCSNKSDIYNLKVGHITADEVSFAGGVYSQANKLYYLYNGQNYWTMSPDHFYYNFSTSSKYASACSVDSDGQFYYKGMDWSTAGVRPVLSLNPNSITITGSGTITDPYVAS